MSLLHLLLLMMELAPLMALSDINQARSQGWKSDEACG